MILHKNKTLSISQALISFNMLPLTSPERYDLGIKIEKYILLISKQLPLIHQPFNTPFTYT